MSQGACRTGGHVIDRKWTMKRQVGSRSPPEDLADVLRRGHEERRQDAPADNDPGWLRTVATLTATEPGEQ